MLNKLLGGQEELGKAFNLHQHNVVLVTTRPTFDPEAAEFLKSGGKKGANSDNPKGRQ